jgi:hypothetical protein
MHKGDYSDSYYIRARFMGRIARSIATISIVFRVYVKLVIDPWIDHLQDHPMGRNPNMLARTYTWGFTLTKWGGHPTSIKKVTELVGFSSERSSYHWTENLVIGRTLYILFSDGKSCCRTENLIDWMKNVVGRKILLSDAHLYSRFVED